MDAKINARSIADHLRAQDDENQIRRLIALYGQLLDDRRFDEWANLFLEDAVVMGHVGREAYVKAIAVGQPSSPTKHVACSTVIDLDGDRAAAWTDGFGLIDVGPGPNGSRTYANFPLRYYDQLVRIDGCWRIARRDYAPPGGAVPDGAFKTPGK